MTEMPDTYWTQLADLITDHVGDAIDEARQHKGPLPQELASKLSDTLTPILWIASVVAASNMDRTTFLNVCGQVYDKATQAVQSPATATAILRLLVPAGDA